MGWNLQRGPFEGSIPWFAISIRLIDNGTPAIENNYVAIWIENVQKVNVKEVIFPIEIPRSDDGWDYRVKALTL